MAKNIIVTGASGNLGKATVEKFLAEGYHIIATVSPGKSLGYDIAGVDVVEVDLTSEVTVEQFVDQVVSRYGSIDAALLLVGAFSLGNISTTTGESLRKMIAVNFETAFYAAKPIFNHMMQLGTGRIILIGSRPATTPAEGKNALAYSMSKSLIFRLAEILNEEGAQKNVVTHVIIPSTMDTPANRAAMPKARFDDWVKPEAIAESMYFLVSERGGPLRETILKVYGNS